MLAQVVLTLGWDGTRLGCILSSIAFAGWWPKTIFIVMYGMVGNVDKVDKRSKPRYGLDSTTAIDKALSVTAI